MSLDVYLINDHPAVQQELAGKIFVREGGAIKEITLEEWGERYPGRTPYVYEPDFEDESEVFWKNITHNLNKMAAEAGIYNHLWRPEAIGITRAGQLIKPLNDGLNRLRSEPARFKQYNPQNGWGDYEGLIEFVSAYLSACMRYPAASVRVSR